MKNQKLVFIVTFLILTTVSFIACRKSIQSGMFESNEQANEAREYMTSIVNSEQSLLNLPYTQLKENANLRRYARIEKIEKSAKWDKIETYNRNNFIYSIVPVNDDVHHLNNKSIESVRYLLFSKADGDKMTMNIIELYATKNSSLGTNLDKKLRKIVENQLFNESLEINDLSASIVFYDRFYYNINSYTTNNGKWEKAKIIVENSPKRPVSGNVQILSLSNGNTNNLAKGLLSTISPMSGCQGCSSYYLIGIWYDLNSGEILYTVVLDSWDECVDPNYIPQGNAPGTSTTTNQNTSSSATVNNNLTNPCMSSTLATYQNKVSSIVTLAFNNENINRPIVFNYSGSTTLPNDENGGLFSMDESNGILTYNILLNQNILPNASKEYMLRTFMHEALHGVLLVNGVSWNNLIQHEEIANNYRNIIASLLRETFPNLSITDADALSWEGLGASTAFQNLTETQRIQIGNILSRYRNHLESGAGTGC